MTFEEITNSVLPWRWKSAHELRSEIDDEIRFHLDQRTQAIAAGGLGEREARERAEALFGDVDRMKLDCLTIQMGERLMLQKIQWMVIGALSFGLIALGLSYFVTVQRQRATMEALHAEMAMQAEMALRNAELAREQLNAVGPPAPDILASGGDRRTTEPPAATPEEVSKHWRARFLEKPDDWRHGFGTTKALIDELSAEEAVRVMNEIWDDLSDTHKQQSLKAFAFQHGHAGTVAVLHLGATDSALEVQNWALGYLEDYAFRSFGDDYEAYKAWYARWNGTELALVLEGNATELVQGLQGRDVLDVADELRDLDQLDLRAGEGVGVDLAQVLRDAGVLLLLEDWIASGDEDAIERAYSWAASVEADEAWLRAHVLPELERGTPASIGGAIRALGRAENSWAVPELIAYLEDSVLVSGDLPRNGIWAAATALAEIGDASVIPTLIGLIGANPCYDTIYGIGYFGLGKLTGVSYDETHDGTWWGDWWSRNLDRFPADVRSLPIPDYGSPR